MKYEDFSQLMLLYGANGDLWEWYQICMKRSIETPEFSKDITQEMQDILKAVHSYHRMSASTLRAFLMEKYNISSRTKSECIRAIILKQFPPPPLSSSTIITISSSQHQDPSPLLACSSTSHWLKNIHIQIYPHIVQLEKLELSELRELYFTRTGSPSFMMTRVQLIVMLTLDLLTLEKDSKTIQKIVFDLSFVEETTPIPQEPEKVKIFKEITDPVASLHDLIELGRQYSDEFDYSFDMKTLYDSIPALEKIHSFIGMNNVKDQLMDQLLYFLQFEKKFEYMHTVLTGPPGVGKTEFAKALGELYLAMGILTKNIFKKVVRSDLIAGFVGQTAIKTRDIVKSCVGGVLFIDEVYSLGSEASATNANGSFSKECIDTLNELLSEHKDQLICIVAGYQEEIEKCFFSYNQGLSSRFPIRFDLKSYTQGELFQIFQTKLEKSTWTLHRDVDLSDFRSDIVINGRHVDNLIAMSKKCHSRRVFLLPCEYKRIITSKDIQNALDAMRQQEFTKADNFSFDFMYI